MRQPHNVLVIPFLRTQGASVAPLFCVLQRADEGWWQWVSGGVEEAESPAEAALREVAEETGAQGKLFALDTRGSVPRVVFRAHPTWPKGLYLVQEHAFAVELATPSITLSPEHTAFEWLGYNAALKRLRWQTNQTALWELRERIRDGNLVEVGIAEVPRQ